MPDLTNLVQYGLAGALMLTVTAAIIRGALVPRRQHEEIVAGMRERYEEMRDDRDYWRESSAQSKSNLERALGLGEAMVKPIRPNGGGHGPVHEAS